MLFLFLLGTSYAHTFDWAEKTINCSSTFFHFYFWNSTETFIFFFETRFFANTRYATAYKIIIYVFIRTIYTYYT